MKIKAVVKYLIIIFVITYACWWGVAALVAYTDFVYGDILPTIIYIIGNFGPAIAALFCIDGRPYLHSLKKFLFSYKKRGIWFFLLFAALVTLTVGLSSMEWNPQMTALNFFISLLGSTFIYGGEEELGWRGILHPALSKKITFPLAALACGVIWALWHLPLWFIEGHPTGISLLLSKSYTAVIRRQNAAHVFGSDCCIFVYCSFNERLETIYTVS